MIALKRKFKNYLRAVKCSIIYAELRKPIRHDLILFTSKNGKELAGNMLRLLIEINRQYGNKYKYIVGLEKSSIEIVKSELLRYGLQDVTIVRYDSVRYLQYLERAAYIFNDSTFPIRFIKRNNQVYVNTWHGTPLKMMGNDSPYEASNHRTGMDNIQKNLFSADYLLFPSDYCEEKMTNAYCLNGLFGGTVLREGYPRNSIFFDEESREKVREEFGLVGKKVYVYMPTFRDGKEEAIYFFEKVIASLNEIEEILNDDECLYIKLHYYDKRRIPVDKYTHIKAFPESIDTYEFLNIADCLISDYSSVVYDFAVTRKKIVRFVFDIDTYAKERGVYEQPVEWPFPIVHSVEDLIVEIRTNKNYLDNDFVKTYCPNESLQSTYNIVRHIFENESCCQSHLIFEHNKEKIFFFSVALTLNGITKSAQNIMNLVNDNRIYYSVYTRKMLRGKEELLKNMPRNDGIIELNGYQCGTFLEMVALKLYYEKGVDTKTIKALINRFYNREAKRAFTGMGFDAYINFDGYGKYIIGLIQHAPGRRIIFVHSDMKGEIKLKQNQNKLCLRDAYGEYDVVAPVREELVEMIFDISGRRDNIHVVNNCQNYLEIIENSKKPITTQAETVVINGNGEDIESFMARHCKIIITIGRFSPEKRHKMLIEAFERLEFENVGLIIIGGYGSLFEETAYRASISNKTPDIMLIQSITNPMPILKQASLFILTSSYEGMPMTLFEAACLNIPIVTVDTEGCRKFMKQYNGMLVENSVEGIIKGMSMAMDGKVPCVNVDFEKFNEKCLRQFEGLFQSKIL